MMVVVKDQLDRIRASERMGQEAAAAVEADITALLRGKSYDHLVVLQKSIQAKLASGEPIDVEYWENLLKKLLVWKSKVRPKCSDDTQAQLMILPRPSSTPCTKSSSETVSNNFANASETKLYRLKRNCSPGSPNLPPAVNGRISQQRLRPVLRLRRKQSRTNAR